MSKDSPPARKVIPYSSGKRPSTFRRLSLPEEGGTALEQALIEQAKAETIPEKKEDSPPIPTTPHDSPPLSTSPHHSPAPTIAPARDFNKRANSLERNALPEGLFPGSSKKIYDALYLRTRGANPPRNRVRAARRDFTQWTDIKNIKTVDGHLRYLLAVGLIIRHWELGSTEGSEYEVRLPEELPRLPTSPHDSPPVPTTQFLGSGNTQFLGSGGYSQIVDSQTTSGVHKTFIKTDERNDDDEAFAEFVATFRQAAREITGRELSVGESQKLKELAEVLVTELKIAAGRTTVSSVPAFLAEHLRRRLWKKEKRQLDAEAAEAPARARTPPLDASGCPDCFGTGMHYPEGYEKGVARCRHEKLSPPSAD